MNRSDFIKTAGILLFLYIFLFSSCSSENKIYLTGRGSGNADFSISLSQLVIRYAEDIAGGFSGGAGKGEVRIFDADKLERHMDSIPGADLVSVSIPSGNKLDFSIKFDHIEEIFPDSNILTFTKKGGTKRVVFNLDADNFSRVTSFLGLGNDEMVETFGPRKGEPYSTGEYLDIADFLFDEYGSKEEINTIMRESFIVTRLSVDGEITGIVADPPVEISFKGAEGMIKVPLLSFLTLAKPIVIEISWQ